VLAGKHSRTPCRKLRLAEERNQITHNCLIDPLLAEIGVDVLCLNREGCGSMGVCRKEVAHMRCLHAVCMSLEQGEGGKVVERC
jgi:hypothetical protein